MLMVFIGAAAAAAVVVPLAGMLWSRSRHGQIFLAMSDKLSAMLRAAPWATSTAASIEAVAIGYRPFLGMAEFGGSKRGALISAHPILVLLAVLSFMCLLFFMVLEKSRPQTKNVTEELTSGRCQESVSSSVSPSAASTFTTSSSCDALSQPSSSRSSSPKEARAQPLPPAPSACETPDALAMTAPLGPEGIDFLAERFLELARVRSNAQPNARRLARKVVHMLQSCGFPSEDISIVLAHASVYFEDISERSANMDSVEVGNILTLLVFLAHSYAQDEHCPLHLWHKHLFTGYCDLGTLNKALVCLMKLRAYKLRVDAAEVQSRMDCLLGKS